MAGTTDKEAAQVSHAATDNAASPALPPAVPETPAAAGEEVGKSEGRLLRSFGFRHHGLQSCGALVRLHAPGVLRS